MKRVFLIFRCVSEALVGLFVLLITLVSIRQTVSHPAPKAFLVGSMIVFAIVLVLGVLLVWDALKVFKRLRAPATA